MAGMVLACAPSFRRDANPDKRNFLDFVSFAGPAFTAARWPATLPVHPDGKVDPVFRPPIILFRAAAAKVDVDS